MPAAYYWEPPLGSDLSVATASNWRIGSGPSLLASQPPDADDHLYFVGGLGQMDCLIPATLTASSGNAFAGIHLLFGPGPTTATGDGESGGGLPGLVGYWNTVTLADSFSVGALTVECGYISQGSSSVPSGNGSTLTVTSSLLWTGGTLNSNSVAGKIDLAPGASGVAEPSFTNPGINGTLNIGSTITLKANQTTASGSLLELREGIYSVMRGHFEVEEHSTLTVNARPRWNGVGVSTQPNGQNVEREEDGSIFNKGTAIFTSKGRFQSTDKVPISLKGPSTRLSNLGVVKIESFVTLDLHVTFDGPEPEAVTPAYHQYAFGVSDPNDTLPETWLEAGSEIVSDQNAQVRIDDGNLYVTPVINPNNNNHESLPRASQVAKIKMGVPEGTPALTTGRTTFLPLVIGQPITVIPSRIAFPWSDTSFATLYVEGGVECDGDLAMNLSRSAAGQSDLIESNRAFTFGDDSKVWLGWQCETTSGPQVGEDVTWTLVDTLNTVGGVNRVPDLDPPYVGSPAINVTLARSPNNSKLLAKN